MGDSASIATSIRRSVLLLFTAPLADAQKEHAARALGSLAVNADNAVAIARAGGIAPLVALATSGTDGQKEYAAGALRILALINADNKRLIENAGYTV